MVRSKPKHSWEQEKKKLILACTAMFARDLCSRNHGELAELYEIDVILSLVQYLYILAFMDQKVRKTRDRAVDVLKPM